MPACLLCCTSLCEGQGIEEVRGIVRNKQLQNSDIGDGWLLGGQGSNSLSDAELWLSSLPQSGRAGETLMHRHPPFFA